MLQEGATQVIELFLRYQLPVVVFLSVVLIFYLVKLLFVNRLERLSEKTASHLDDMAAEVVREIRWPTVVVLAYIGAGALAADGAFQMPMWLRVVLILVITYQTTKISHVLFRYSKQQFGEGGAMIIDGFRSIISLVIYAVGLLVVFTALGYNVTSLVAGLGIGGIAVAFALQNILSDIFSSLSIYLDQPFRVGDFIAAGEHKGTVKRIGLKTTRIKSLDGEMIIVANKDLTNSTIKNYRGLTRRRVSENLGFAYRTTNAKLAKLQEDLPAVINGIDGAEFSRLHFNSFGDSALEHTLVYYIDSDSFNHYVAIKNSVNLAIKGHLQKKKLELAFPTTTVHLKK